MCRRHPGQQYMIGRPSGKYLWFGITAAVVLMVVGVVVFMIPEAPSSANTNITNTNITNTNRQRYASLYDAAWRQDSGQDTTLVTATLFVPPTIEALGHDLERSSVEEQLWNATKSLDAKTIPIVLTFDSVTGFLADEKITTSLSLQGSNGQSLNLVSWLPMIAPTRIVNTPGSTSSQIGVALFSAQADIDWQTIGTLKLTVTGIGGTELRLFSWVEPKLLFEL